MHLGTPYMLCYPCGYLVFFSLSFFFSCLLGFREIKKVDILWKDKQKASKSHDDSFGELYLRVSMSGQCHITSLWSALMNDCHQIMDMIDWTRSHPDNIRSFCLAYGIDAGLQFFLTVCFS